MKSKMEKAFQEALENYEVAYNPEAWQALKNQLPVKSKPWYFYGGAAAIGLVAILGVTLILTKSEETKKPSNQNTLVETPMSQDLDTQSTSQSGVKASTTVLEQNESPKTSSTSQQNEASSQDNSRNLDNNSQALSSTSSPTQNIENQNESPNNSDFGPIANTADSWQERISNIEFKGLKDTYCENEKVLISIQNLPERAQVTWSSGASKSYGNSYKVSASNSLVVSVVIEDLNSQNKYKKSIHFKTIGAELPIVQVQEQILNTKTFVTLENTNPNIEHLAWRFEGNSLSGASIGAYLTKKGAHDYVVESYDNNGCYAKTTGSVDINEDYALYVENSFSPNGDGINDTFLPEALKQRSVRFTMTIFDMNQNQVFSTRDVYSPWDGTISGSPAPKGTYIWVVTLINEEGNPEQYKGTLLLIR